jgi:chaperone modulatory protein CbpM
MSKWQVSRAELLRLLDLTEDELVEWESEGLVVSMPDGSFEEIHMRRLRLCRNLKHELGVNQEGIEVALHLLDRLHAERRAFRLLLGELDPVEP